jgi:hypothetical protein
MYERYEMTTWFTLLYSTAFFLFPQEEPTMAHALKKFKLLEKKAEEVSPIPVDLVKPQAVC